MLRGRGRSTCSYELFERGQSAESIEQREKQWESFNFSSYDNPLIDKNEIDELVKEISPALRDQEVFGKFVDKETSGIIKSEWWRVL